MDIKHITSDTLRSLLGLTDKKDQLIKAVAGVEDELAKALTRERLRLLSLGLG